MFTDYKFWYIKRNDAGFITEAAIRFYEGEYVELENGETYHRTKRLQTVEELEHLTKLVNGNPVLQTKQEANGNHAILYTPTDFGSITTDEELTEFLNKQLAKDDTRTPIQEQEWQP